MVMMRAVSGPTLAEKGRGHDRIRLVIDERISRFIHSPAAPDSGSFEDLALAAAAAEVSDWRQVPLAPIAPHPLDPDLFRQVVDATFPRFCLPHLSAGVRLPILSLIPHREPEPGLSLLAEQVISRHGGPESATTVGNRGVEVAKARSWAGARQREGLPVLILATTSTLAQWLGGLDRLDLRFRLPPGSVLFEMDELPGKAPEVSREDLLRRIAERLGLPSGQVVRGYWRPGLTSFCCTRALYGEDPDLFVAPAWVRVRVLDPETREEVAAGQAGRIAVFDLANLGSPLHRLTEDVGIIDGLGFRLAAAASGPPPRTGLPPEAPG